ncbi:MAG: TA system VapC family ribonuclease toxin [Nakamurella sp.]
MKIVDANVLLFASNSSSRQHVAANSWLTGALTGNEAIGFPWVSLLAFIRIGTNPRIFDAPLSVANAFDIVETWLAAPPATIVVPAAQHPAILRDLLERSGSAGNLVTDSHLAALAVEHRAEIVTFDRDFERFAIRIHVPQ